MNHKYLVFHGHYYYPDGGWKDFNESFLSLEEAIEHIKDLYSHYCWAHVVFNCQIILEVHSEWDSENKISSWKFKDELDVQK